MCSTLVRRDGGGHVLSTGGEGACACSTLVVRGSMCLLNTGGWGEHVLAQHWWLGGACAQHQY